MHLLFCFNHFLDARAEIRELFPCFLGELKRLQFPFKISRPLANALTCAIAKFFIAVDKVDLCKYAVGEALLNRPRMPFSLESAHVMLTNNLMMNVV